MDDARHRHKSEIQCARIAFGFGGRVFRSADQGAHWQPVALEEKQPLVSGLVLADGSVVLLTYDGRILRSDDQGRSFKPASGNAGMSVAAMAQIDKGGFIVAGTGGTRIVSINSATKTRQP